MQYVVHVRCDWSDEITLIGFLQSCAGLNKKRDFLELNFVLQSVTTPIYFRSLLKNGECKGDFATLRNIREL